MSFCKSPPWIAKTRLRHSMSMRMFGEILMQTRRNAVKIEARREEWLGRKELGLTEQKRKPGRVKWNAKNSISIAVLLKGAVLM